MNDLANKIFELKAGLIFALLTIFFGTLLGGILGTFEDSVKNYLNVSANQVYLEVYKSNTKELVKVVDKSWTNIRSSHFYANGIGTTSLVLILLLGFMRTKVLLRKMVAVFLGVGGLGYSLFWLFVGFSAPSLGSTGVAKAMFTWLSIPSTGIYILGVFFTMVLVIDEILITKK